MRQKVLIIDDSRLITMLVQSRLADEAIDLFVANDGAQGLEIAARIRPDLILLDVEMPEPDGFAVCRTLKSNADTMAIPVVFLTGMSTSEEKLKGLELGAIDYITKPFDPAELRARVRASLRTKYLLDLLASKAQIDGLTGLWTRGHFDQRLASELSLARRTGHPLSCVRIEVDHFQQVTDGHGHPAADEALREMARLLSGCVRLEDVVCRLGGAAFGVVLPNTAVDRAAKVAERMRQAVSGTTMAIGGRSVAVTCSFGLTAARADAATTLAAAGDALSRAQTAGRNRVEVAAAAPLQHVPAA
jgi:diguanylate cyclase (GGDEF)-like protein